MREGLKAGFDPAAIAAFPPLVARLAPWAAHAPKWAATSGDSLDAGVAYKDLRSACGQGHRAVCGLSRCGRSRLCCVSARIAWPSSARIAWPGSADGAIAARRHHDAWGGEALVAGAWVRRVSRDSGA